MSTRKWRKSEVCKTATLKDEDIPVLETGGENQKSCLALSNTGQDSASSFLSGSKTAPTFRACTTVRKFVIRVRYFVTVTSLGDEAGAAPVNGNSNKQ